VPHLQNCVANVLSDLGQVKERGTNKNFRSTHDVILLFTFLLLNFCLILRKRWPIFNERTKRTVEGGCATRVIVSATEFPLRFVLLGLRPSADVSQPGIGFGIEMKCCVCNKSSKKAGWGKKSGDRVIARDRKIKSFTAEAQRRGGKQGSDSGGGAVPQRSPTSRVIRKSKSAPRRCGDAEESKDRTQARVPVSQKFNCAAEGGCGPQGEMNGKLARILHDRRKRGT
jgi:hypothetical protein